MNIPKFGFNKLQSFIEFVTTVGAVKFGLEGLKQMMTEMLLQELLLMTL